MKTVRWVSVVFMLALFPITTAAQTSLYGLPSGKFGAGFEIIGKTGGDFQVLWGNVGLGLNRGRSKGSLRLGMPSKDAGVPAYYFGTEAIHFLPVGSAGYELFTKADVEVFLIKGAGGLPRVYRGGLGLSKRIGSGNSALKPFAGLFYENLQVALVNRNTTIPIVGIVSTSTGIQVGLEYKVSRFSIIGSVSYPFYTTTVGPDTIGEPPITFRLGVNLLHSTQVLEKNLPPIPRDKTPPPVTVNFVSADPSSGSTIKPDATITVTFDDSPGEVAVNQGTATTAGRIVSISGPFSAGSLSLNISWADGVQRLTYTVDDPTPTGMVLVPAGEFQMGSNDPEAYNDEQPEHTVFIDAFYIDRYEVTNAQYQQFVLANPSWQKHRIDSVFHSGDYLKEWNGNDYPSGKANHPVASVSWYAAMAYAKWAGKRLPTEAEWEKAARSGWVGQKYLWHDGVDSSKTNYDKNVGDTTAVGKYPPNSYGLYDMTGNVWEWCLDEYNADFYSISSRENPHAGANPVDWDISDLTSIQTDRVLRGGSWGADSGSLRIAYRFRLNPASAYLDCGFRCVMSQSDPSPGRNGIAPQKEKAPPPAEPQSQSVSTGRNDIAPQKEEESPPPQQDQRVLPPGPSTELPLQKEEVPPTEPQGESVSTGRNEPTPPKGMVLIPAGEFQMGSTYLTNKESQPVHTVYLDAFYIDTHEVTVGAYKQFLKETQGKQRLSPIAEKHSPTDEHPIVDVSWHDAMAYAQWAGKRLPTEAEWEKAARGPDQFEHYPWAGEDIGSSQANFNGTFGGILPVGRFKPNGYGLYDIAGNVFEWCLDPFFNDFYENSPAKNPFAGFQHKTRDETIADFKSVKGQRVIRGGTWKSEPLNVRVDLRNKADGTNGYTNVGFRCVKDIQ